ncbi:sulfate transporter family protein [Methylobacterium radiodurans]|uniref:Sulfate transporter family protein n=1 Tax=Methylobacterium radiodurans TaxID=2202828 RepID=A0A2U8VQY6_9HYPH|nr:sulfate transporter family protein [Methylobacterium radiodurans]AWN35636.1 sulfate transporter family protein [Methylobacterium radiodurans]
MLIQSAFAAFRQTLSPPLRAILWKSLGLTLGLLVLVWFGLTRLIQWFQASHHISEQYPLLDTLAYFLAGFGLFVALAYVMPAVSILVAGFFLDDAAEIVERTDFPGDSPGRALPFGTAMLYAARFAGLTLLVNIGALIIFFVPVVGIAAFFAANAYLLSREYFEMAAARFRPLPEAAAMRRDHAATTLAAGCLLAGMMVVPVLNLVTPLFGIALMVHVHKRLARRLPAPAEPGRLRQGPLP